MKRSASLVAVVIAAVVAGAVAADETDKIGQVRFPVTCSTVPAGSSGCTSSSYR